MNSGKTDYRRESITGAGSPLFHHAIIDCIGKACDPTTETLLAVAARIWMDSASDRSAFDWDQLSARSVARCTAVRAAQLALYGEPVDLTDGGDFSNRPVKTSKSESDNRKRDVDAQGRGPERHDTESDRPVRPDTCCSSARVQLPDRHW